MPEGVNQFKAGIDLRFEKSNLQGCLCSWVAYISICGIDSDLKIAPALAFVPLSKIHVL